MADSRPNFFQLLELDPSVDDWPTIQKEIAKKKKYWNQIRTQRTGPKQAAAKANLDLLPEIERVLGDPNLRRQEAAARRAEIEVGQQEVLNKLDQMIETFRDRGHITDIQVDNLADHFAEVMTRAEIETRLKAAGVRVGASPTASAGPFQRRDFLDDSKVEEIRHGLGVLGFADLYAFLGLSADTSADVLAARGKQRYQESAGRADEKSTAVQKLAGLAEDLFSSSAGKDRYDATLATLPMRELRDQIELMVENGELAYEDFERLATMAGRHGVDVQAAKSFLGWFAEQRNWTLGEPPEMPSPPDPRDHVWEQRFETLFRAFEAQQRATTQQPNTVQQGPDMVVDPPPPPPPHRPLQAPPSIQVRPVAGGFDVEWAPVHEPGASYWVVRKDGGPPTDEGDGEGTELAVCRFEDRNVPPGAWYYGVFTLLQEAISPHPVFSGPHRPARRSAAPKAVAAAMIIAGGVGAAWALGLIPFPPSGQGGGGGGGGGGAPPPPPSPVHQSHVIPPPVMPPPPPAPPKAQIRQKPKVLVVANGEPMVKRTLETHLVGELRQRGLDVEAGSGRFLTGDYIARGGASSALALLPVLDQENVDVLVFAAVEPRGQRQLSFLGRTETSYTSEIQARAYLVRNRNQLGGLESATFEYTILNLGEKLEDSLYGMGAPLASAALAGWSNYRKSQGLTP